MAQKQQNSGNLGFEAKLWQAADKMRGHMDASEYKHVALGLIFLKYISDAFENIRSFCKSTTLDEIKAHGHVLTHSHYVGAADVEDDGEPFEEKMPKLVAQLEEQLAKSAGLEQKIRASLEGLDDYGE